MAPAHTPLQGALGFRRQPRATGLASVAEPYPQVDIKMGRKCVGWIKPPSCRNQEQHWRIWILVRCIPTEEKPCPWAAKRLTAKFTSENMARAWLGDVYTELRTKYDLYPQEM